MYYISSSYKLHNSDGRSSRHGGTPIPPAPDRVAPDDGAPEIGVRDGGRYEKPANQEPAGEWVAGASPRIGSLLLRFVKIGVSGSSSSYGAIAWPKLARNESRHAARREFDALCSAIVTK